LSDKQLKIVAVFLLCIILAENPNAECTVEELMRNNACEGCFSVRQGWQILVALIAQYALDQSFIPDLDLVIQEAACLNCASDKQIQGMLIGVLARGIETGTLFCPI
jgi:hypothetical protein